VLLVERTVAASAAERVRLDVTLTAGAVSDLDWTQDVERGEETHPKEEVPDQARTQRAKPVRSRRPHEHEHNSTDLSSTRKRAIRQRAILPQCRQNARGQPRVIRPRRGPSIGPRPNFLLRPHAAGPPAAPARSYGRQAGSTHHLADVLRRMAGGGVEIRSTAGKKRVLSLL
jgi:hypothetical protein